MSCTNILPGVKQGKHNDNIVIMIDDIDENRIEELHDYIVNYAKNVRSSKCVMEIAQNEKHYLDGLSCDLVYVEHDKRFHLYDVDYHVTFETSIYHMKEALVFTTKHFDYDNE